MNAPVVALDWLGDMSAPSVLPRRKCSLSTCVEEEEEDRTVPSSIFGRYGSSSSEAPEEASGTVKRKVPSPVRPSARSPIRFDGGRDLFSPGLGTSCLGQRRSQILNNSSSQFEPDLELMRRRSFPRPRIVTETFKDPSKSSTPCFSAQAAPMGSTAIAVQEALRRIDSRQVFDVFFSDALRGSGSRSPSPTSSVYSQSSGSEVWTTPPTTQKPAGRINPVRDKYPNANLQTQPSRAAIKSRASSPTSPNFSRPLPGVVAHNYPSRPSRKVSFADRSFPWEKDGDDLTKNGRKSSLAEGSPFPAPPGRQEKRNFSFEPGLHAQERKCEVDYEEKQRSRAQHYSKRLAKRKRESGQRAVRRSRASATSELALRHEHQRLRQEMVLLRGEFRALRQVLVGSRREG
jgi:hypothetical protein